MKILLKILRIFVVISLSLLVFYFFETPFLIETAFAEESLGADSSSRETPPNIGTKAEALSNSNATATEPPNTKESESSFVKKVGYFLWDYKWHILLTSIIIVSSIWLYSTISSPLSDSQTANAWGAANLPNWKTFVEDTNLKYSVEAVKNLPEHFMVGKGCLTEGHLTGVLVDLPDTQNNMPFRVYPTKPILHEDPSLSILVNQHQAVPQVLVDNPYGFSSDPSMIYWVNHAKALYPILNEPPPSLILQYQKVALVDPFTLNYAYFHQVSLVPINIETLSTPFETNLKEDLVRVYLFKDNEAGWEQ